MGAYRVPGTVVGTGESNIAQTQSLQILQSNRKRSTNPIIAQVTNIVNYTVMHAVDRALKNIKQQVLT